MHKPFGRRSNYSSIHAKYYTANLKYRSVQNQYLFAYDYDIWNIFYIDVLTMLYLYV